ncbi:MAG TPA: shikimate dehydrogenase [Acidimicrobiales bacterium]|nr:shikimate dehydrogenase [Acidimicrobiales bacterium]
MPPAGPPERRSPTWPSAAAHVVGVMGEPVGHSLSPLLHNAAFDALGLDWVSVGFPVPAGGVPAAFAGIRALGIVGLSVTMPHKEDAAAAVDTLTPVATRLGAVNCVVREDGMLVGDSTDGAGFVASLHRGPGFDPAGARCVVVGAGGAARAVVLALADAGAESVVVVNRSPARAAAAAVLAGAAGSVGDPEAVRHADLVVQATPVGMARGSATDDMVPFDPDLLRPGQVVADLVVHPLETPLLRAAAQRGATPLPGLGMLVHQAALALERWTGRAAPVEAMWRAVQGHLADRERSG